jgi:hypothetical protein
MKTGFVRERALDSDGKPIRTGNKHPALLDTCKYVVEFPNGTEQIYSANLLAENMIAQCDEGNQFILLNGIVDRKSDEDVISKEEGYFYQKTDDIGRRQQRDGSYASNEKTGLLLGNRCRQH